MTRTDRSRPPRSAVLALALAATAVAAPAVPLLLRRRRARGKEDPARLPERVGRAGLPRPEGPLLWFHAASVGESLSLLTLIDDVLGARPDLHILLTTGTRSSATLMAARLPARCLHQFVPVDTPAAVRRFLHHWRPDLAVWTESELWPRLIVETHRAGTPLLLVNARMSAASVRRWGMARGMLAALLARFDAVIAQDADTADALQAAGLAPDRLSVAGSLKEDTGTLPHDAGALAVLRKTLGARPVWLAASTHPGEEEIVAAAHARLRRELPEACLILAPRHPDRANAVAAILDAAGLDHARRSAGALPGAAAVYLADTLGEMGLWYRLAPVAFVGGSLVEVGGHNPYEPAALGAAIVTGPHTGNFAGIFARLTAAGGARTVRDAGDLAAAVAALQERATRDEQIDSATRATTGGGATARARACILAHLPAPAAA